MPGVPEDARIHANEKKMASQQEALKRGLAEAEKGTRKKRRKAG